MTRAEAADDSLRDDATAASGANRASPCLPPDGCPRTRRLVTGALLTILPAVLFINVWRAGGVAAVGDDLIYYLPMRAYVGEQLRAGHLPLWNPYVSLGAPLAGDPQAGLWYPFTWLFVVMPPLVAYCVSLWLHYVLAGWGMYRFLRALGRAWPAAILGGLAFEFCPYLIAHREHLTIHHAVAWIPWIFWAFQRYAALGAAGRSAPSKSALLNPRRRGAALLAAGFWGMQLLVQHIQPSIMTAAVLAAYVLVILRPMCSRVVLTWLIVMGGGAVLASVQLVPTFHLFAGSGRSTPAYYLFVENTWVLSSALTFLFPMIFGNPTPNLWSEKWWGISHLSEQWVYPTLMVVTLAGASIGFLRRRPARAASAASGAVASESDGRRARAEALFWWSVCGVALVIALGDLTPVSKLLFHLPIYRSLRVPARWTLVWSFALPVLASLTLDAMWRGGMPGIQAARNVVRTATRVLPGLMALCLLVMWSLPWLAGVIAARTQNRDMIAVLSGLGAAMHRINPAVIGPVVMMALTLVAVVRLSRVPGRGSFVLLVLVFLLDVASVAPFVAVDTRTYSAGDILRTAPLTTAIREINPEPGQRLLVPRREASYERPLEVLWPQSNVAARVETLNGYGPLWDSANRLLLRFMAWGSSQEIISLLRNTPLLQRLGVRYIAVRSGEEREMLRAARLPAVAAIDWQSLGSEQMQDVSWESGLLWPVRLDEPGLYAFELDAAPVFGSPSRWFVGLETPDHDKQLAPTHAVDPADLACGPRRMRFTFLCEQPPGAGFIRVKSEMGVALRAGRARFGRVAGPVAVGQADGMPGLMLLAADVGGGVSVYELGGARPLVWLPGEIHLVATVADALAWLLGPGAAAAADAVVVEGAPFSRPSRDGYCQFQRLAPEWIEARVQGGSEQLLVLNASCSRGWTATLDGAPVELLRVNAITQGVRVPAGRHEVHFTYRQPGLVTGAMLSAAGWLLLWVAFLHTRWSSRIE